MSQDLPYEEDDLTISQQRVNLEVQLHKLTVIVNTS